MVEDNLGDVRLMREALKDSSLQTNLRTVRDGVKAMNYLRREGKYHDTPRPDLILLDLNLPRKDGREVLAEIKADESLRRIPVVILSSSKAEEDIRKSYELNASCYITKPAGLHEFMSVIRSIENFWLTIVEVPPKG